VQVEAAVAPSIGEKVPDEHGAQTVVPVVLAYIPRSHALHASLPLAENVPSAQLEQVDESAALTAFEN
jgi:hypothetical protein